MVLKSKDGIVSFVIACVAPLNLIKGAANSLIVLLVYKPLSPIIKGTGKTAANRKKESVSA